METWDNLWLLFCEIVYLIVCGRYYSVIGNCDWYTDSAEQFVPRCLGQNLKLKINMDKSNIIVFRKGGYLASHERWFYDEMKMEVVNSYMYFGISFTTQLSFTFACEELVCLGKKAVINILSKLYKLGNVSFDVFFDLFDAQLQPIVWC